MFCSVTDRRRVSRREQYEPAARGTFSASSDKYVLVVCQIRLRPSLPKSARKNTPCGAKQFYRELILGKDKAKTQFIQGYERGFQRKITQNQPRKIRVLLFSSAYPLRSVTEQNTQYFTAFFRQKSVECCDIANFFKPQTDLVRSYR